MRRRIGADDFRGARGLVPQFLKGPWEGDGTSELWWVCDDYEVHGDKLVATFPLKKIEGRSRWRSYRPLEEAQDLFLKFVRLHEAPDFEKAVLRFCRKYGALHHTTGDEQREYTLSEFRLEAWRAWIVLRLYEAALNQDRQAAALLLYSGLEEMQECLFALGMTGLKRSFLLTEFSEDVLWQDAAVRAVTTIVGGAVHKYCFLGLVLHSGEDRFPAHPSHIKSTIGFRNLLGVMYLQLYWLLASGGNLARCEHCGYPISLARPTPDGRKRRRDKRFCDDACRQAHHRSRKKG